MNLVRGYAYGKHVTLDTHQDTTLAGFRPNSEIIGKFRKLEKLYGHFVKRQKWRIQAIFWGVGVF